MKIGVIGTGNIGATLARKMIAAGHEVQVANSKGIEGFVHSPTRLGRYLQIFRALFETPK